MGLNTMKEFKLDNHPKIKTGFKTPEGYFDTLYNRMDLPTNEISEPKVISIFSLQKKILYAVAAILVVAISIPLVTNVLQTPKATSISTDSIEDYLSYSQTVSNQEITELLTDEDIQSLEKDLAMDTNEIETILTESEYLEDYLID